MRMRHSKMMRTFDVARQTAFGCVTNIRRTSKCYLSTVGTSKGICVQYIFVGSIRCLGECRTIYKFTHINVRIVFTSHAAFAFRCKPTLRHITNAAILLFFLYHNMRILTSYLGKLPCTCRDNVTKLLQTAYGECPVHIILVIIK